MNPLCTLHARLQSPLCDALVTSGSGSLLQRLDRLQHLVDMAGHLDAAPLLDQHAIGVDQEGAALDALDLLAVHDLVLDHAEHVAELFLGVGDQLERQFEVLLELEIGRAVQQECRDRSRMPSSA
eukprot:TRINITY_DN1640_c0_g1_i9.p2 TRINITY_DN1640_c0_g1~~TRINITY_DN1640_c0_g1_i9.p2  ORF type:complete len:125 (-),score=21.69 TRINITY_DN1640_c0_g1_i9:78-452(-)